jgi:hypothetical protein
MSLLSLVILSLGSVAFSQSVDPCSLIAAGVPADYATGVACLDSIPFNATRLNATIDNLLNGMQLYTFLDIAANPPAPFDAVDLLGELKALRSLTFDSDLRMHIAISDVFRKLGDAHTLYRPPACFGDFSFYNPLTLFGFADRNGNPALGVADPARVASGLKPANPVFQAVLAQYGAEWGANWESAFADATVVSVDGGDPWAYLFDFANTSVGLTKSAETRAFLSLTKFFADSTQLGMWTHRSIIYNGVPPPNATFEILPVGASQSMTVTANFSFASTVAIKSAQNLQQLCYPRGGVANRKGALFEHDEVKLLGGASALPSLPAGPTGWKQIYSDNQFTTFWFGMSSNTPTLALFVPTFSIPDATSATTFANSLLIGFAMGQKLGATKLIIDLTANGGGNICAGLALLNATNLLLGEVFSDMPGSQLADAMATSLASLAINGTAWSPDLYDSAATGEPFTDASWLVPGVNHTRGGKTRTYSQLLHLSYEACGGALFPFDLVQFNASQIHIVTHGECGSTCALFALHASRYAHVKTTVIGVHDPASQQLCSFPGLQVVEDSEIYSTIAQARVTGPLVPQPLAGGGSWRVCIREIYGPNNHHTPLEYRWIPADSWILPNIDDAKVFGSYWTQL